MINWDKIKHFSKSEFVDDADLAEPMLIRRLDFLRDIYGKPIYPSPVKGSLARFGGSPTSQHYVGDSEKVIVRHSTGVDIFPSGVPMDFLTHVIVFGYFNGIGIYLDTKGVDGKSWSMFHLDIRELGYKIGVPLIWIAETVKCKDTGKLKRKYRYPQLNPEYWSLLQNEKLYTSKK